MGSCKIKNKPNNFLLQGKRARKQSQLNKNLGIQCLWCPTNSLGFSKGLGSFLGLYPLVLYTHRSLLCLVLLHAIPVALLGRCSTILASPKCWGLLLNLSCTFTDSTAISTKSINRFSSWYKTSSFLHGPFNSSVPVTFSHPSQCQISTALYDSSLLSKPVSLGRLIQDQVWLPV